MTSVSLLHLRDLVLLKKQRLITVKYLKDEPGCQLSLASGSYEGRNPCVAHLEFDPCPLVAVARARRE